MGAYDAGHRTQEEYIAYSPRIIVPDRGTSCKDLELWKLEGETPVLNRVADPGSRDCSRIARWLALPAVMTYEIGMGAFTLTPSGSRLLVQVEYMYGLSLVIPRDNPSLIPGSMKDEMACVIYTSLHTLPRISEIVTLLPHQGLVLPASASLTLFPLVLLSSLLPLQIPFFLFWKRDSWNGLQSLYLWKCEKEVEHNWQRGRLGAKMKRIESI